MSNFNLMQVSIRKQALLAAKTFILDKNVLEELVKDPTFKKLLLHPSFISAKLSQKGYTVLRNNKTCNYGLPEGFLIIGESAPQIARDFYEIFPDVKRLYVQSTTNYDRQDALG